MRDDPEVLQAAAAFQFGRMRIHRAGQTGELLGRGAGSSLEFQEYREYLPGDDIRHLDWAAFARTDSLMVRLYQEEISPRVEIFLDCSQSMNTQTPLRLDPPAIPKSIFAKQLTALFALLTAKLGGNAKIFLVGDDRPAMAWGLAELAQLRDLKFEARRTLADFAADQQIPPARQAVRIVISDILFPHDSESVIRQFGMNAGSLWVFQLLTGWEANPAPLGGRRLIDLEAEIESDLMMDEAVVAGYRGRLQRLQQELGICCRRQHGVFSPIVTDPGLLAVCRDLLCRLDVLQPV